MRVFDVADTADIAFGHFLIDHRRRLLMAAGSPVPLQQRTFDLLAFLAANRNRAVSREEILHHVFGGQLRAASNVPVQVHNLRRAITQAGGDPGIIQTVGPGYRFIADVTNAAPPQTPGPPPAPTGAPAQPSAHRWWRDSRAAASAGVLAICAAAFLLWFGRSSTGLSPTLPFAPPPHSVAVLAFSNMSGDPTEEYFADGLSEELINVLGRVRELKVVARTSSFYFKGKQATIADIARALNVGAVLQGSVRRQAHRVRIGVALSDALTGYQLWSDSFDRNEDDLLTLQGEIATDVSRALQVTLLGEGAADLTLGGTANPRAFDHYLQAIQLRRKNQLRAAVTEFAAAVSTDTGFALARSGLAEAAMRIAWTVGGTADIDSLVAIARQSAEQGVALAPSIGLVHAVRAQILREADYDLRDAMREASLARSLTPGDASVELIYGQVAGSLGLVEDAAAAYQRAVELDPLRQEGWAFLGFGLMASRQYEASIAAFRHSLTVATGSIPEFTDPIGLNLILLGRPAEAIDACKADSTWAGNVCLALAYQAAGRHADSERVTALLRQQSGGNDHNCNFVMIYAAWKRTEEAMRLFKELADDRNSCLNVLGGVKANPFLDPLRPLPQFQAALKALDQPPGAHNP